MTSKNVDILLNDSIYFRKMWAATNKTKTKISFVGVAIQAFVWLTCILTAMHGFGLAEEDSLLYNLSVGFRWLIVATVISLDFFIPILLIFMVATASNLRDYTALKDRRAKELYSKYKGSVADALAYEFNFKKKLFVVGVLLQTALLFAGGAVIAGLIFLFSYIWLKAATWFENQAIINYGENLITPDNVKWLESSENSVGGES